MENKFGRIKAFVEELEKVEIIETEEALLLLQTGGGDGYWGTGNNCQCNGNNCSCNTQYGCGNTGSGSGGKS